MVILIAVTVRYACRFRTSVVWVEMNVCSVVKRLSLEKHLTFWSVFTLLLICNIVHKSYGLLLFGLFMFLTVVVCKLSKLNINFFFYKNK